MGLSSSVNFSTSQVDPTSLLATPSRQSDAPSDNPSEFDRHLDDVSNSDDTPAARAANRRNDQSQRDTSQSDADTPSTDEGTASSQKNANTQAKPKVTAVTVRQADATPVTNAKTGTANTQPAAPAKTDQAAGTPADPLSGKSADAKDALATEAAASLPAKPKGTDATSSNTDEKGTKTAGKKKAETGLPEAVVVPTVATPIAATKTKTTDTSAGKAPVAAAPALPADTPLAAAAAMADAQGQPGDQKAQADATNTDPDAGLAIKATKDGLGHQAAAHMAEKANDKNAAAGPQTAAQAAAAQTSAPAAASPPATFVAKVASAPTDGGVQAISSASSTDGSAARLTDLQNVGNSQNQSATTATVRIGTLPGQTQPTQLPAMTIALQIARNLQKGVNRFDIRLDPVEMGRIDVRMEVSRDGTVAAHLTADRPETLSLLQRDAGSLQQALSDAGLQANPDSLNFSLRDQNAGGNAQNFSAGNAAGSSFGVSATDETVTSPVYNVNLAANGGVDIRV